VEDDTIRITVRLSGHLRRFGAGERELSLPKTATLRAVLRVLADSSPELQGVLFGPSGEPNAQILMFVDDEQSQPEQSVSQARSVTLMLPISGG
jgi:molybdopterin converting factor small subunit